MSALGKLMVLRYNANLEVQYPAQTLMGQLGDAARDDLKARWTERAYESGQMILDVEDTAAEVMILLQGAVRVANFSSRGREVSFTGIEEGDCFGEFGAIDGAPRSASVMAIAPTRVALVPGATFRALLERHPDLSMALLRRLTEKLRVLTRRVSEFTAMRADDRIRLEVLRLFQAARARDGSALLTNPPTQAALAALVFTNREAVAREIGRMKRLNLIERRGRALYAPDVAKIEAYQQAESGL
ncbi:cyclic nucleotide-binding domain-containing protein [Rhodobacteraceae bacterium 2CG4]|uniref:Cyclic nucleotide-binding domain-containing protein n=1 Tax=Halovulum marinum TaxID=2662447 RepID=A0A6L5Z2A6_9RHOB|nr:Crp/Fnr family transcriptional regulator [Halovulum marinum]MSU90648.1 cyclic nucleotide-binding domain-containing protein [Halovulum marinum]